MSEVELEYWANDKLEWLLKVNERLTLILLSIKEKRDISEADYDILKVFHHIYSMGLVQFFRSKPNLSDEMALQQGLFGQVDSTADRGIEFEYELPD